MSHFTCTLCPRNCKIDRKNSFGFCGAPYVPRIAKAMLHQWEEPCICYGKGSGAIFFSGCQLKCVFCQNQKISRQICGKELDQNKLCKLFFSLEEQGACNINLVSPTPYLDTIIPALELAKKDGLSLPIVFNSGGYESTETLKRLRGLVDIYLPDFKFYSKDLSTRYAKVSDYTERCVEAIDEMLFQTGDALTKDNKLIKGTIVRHLVLPGCSSDSIKILQCLYEHFSGDRIILSLLRQYTPMVDTTEYPELSRAITSLEYSRVVKAAQELGFTNIYTQSKQSVGEEYIPDFSIFSEK